MGPPTPPAPPAPPGTGAPPADAKARGARSAGSAGARRLVGQLGKLGKGVAVRVLAGPFEGKAGVVQELDGKGLARVVLGTMSTWVPLADLTQDGGGTARPPFKSSHRKPFR